MTILYTSFHILDLDNDTVQRKEMPEEFQDFVKEYIEYANSNEKNKMYTVHDEQTQVVSCIRQMALNQEKCEVLTDSIADKLLMSEKLAQAKIYRMGSNVKKGSLIQALVQNSSDELLFVVAKVEHSNGMMEVIYQRSMDFQEIRNHCGNQLYFQCMKLIRILYLKMSRHIQILWQNIGQFHSWS